MVLRFIFILPVIAYLYIITSNLLIWHVSGSRVG